MYTSTLIVAILCFSYSNGSPLKKMESSLPKSFTIEHKDGSTAMYQISDAPMDQAAAKAFCEGLGGILAEPRDATQTEEINGLLDPSFEYWIGIERCPEDGNWEWNTDGMAADYTNWADGEPTATGDCVQLCGTHGFMWEANDCANPEEFALCQL